MKINEYAIEIEEQRVSDRLLSQLIDKLQKHKIHERSVSR